MRVLCDHCGIYYDENYPCPGCGRTAKGSDKAEKPTDEKISGTHFCAFCGAKVNNGIKFCPICGKAQAVTPAPEPTPVPAPVYAPAPAPTPVPVPTPEQPKYDIPPEVPEIPKISVGKKPDEADDKERGSNVKKPVRIIAIVIAAVLFVSIFVPLFSVIRQKSVVSIDLDDYISEKVLTDEDVAEESSTDKKDSEITTDEESPEDFFVNDERGPGLIISGFNGSATIDTDILKNVVNWDKLIADVNEKLNKTESDDGSTLTFNDFFGELSFSFNISASENITNGQLVTARIIGKGEYERKGVTVKISDGSHEYTVYGLSDAKLFNPFEYVSPTQYGANGYAHMGISIDEDTSEKIEGIDGFYLKYYAEDTLAVEKDGYIISKIRFYFDNDTEYNHSLKNGDMVTLYCEMSVDLTDEYHVGLSKTENTYELDGLGEFATKNTIFVDKDLDELKSYASKTIKTAFGESSSYSGFRFAGAYIVDNKDLTTTSSFHNSVCIMYSYNYQGYFSDETDKEYICIEFNDVIIDKDGNMKFSAEDYYNDYDYGNSSIESYFANNYSSSYNVAKLSKVKVTK